MLPPPKRKALSAIYATARCIDDIGDGRLAAAEKIRRLESIRSALHALPREPGERPVTIALADAVLHMPIPLEAFDELIDGCVADVQERSYQSFGDLLGTAAVWPARSAGSPSGSSAPTTSTGRPIWPMRWGVALQLTNILRDVREDRENGRIYLPAEDLDRFGVTLDLDPDSGFTDPPDRLAALLRFEAERALRWYDVGLRLLPVLDRRSAACTAAMAGDLPPAADPHRG